MQQGLPNIDEQRIQPDQRRQRGQNDGEPFYVRIPFLAIAFVLVMLLYLAIVVSVHVIFVAPNMLDCVDDRLPLKPTSDASSETTSPGPTTTPLPSLEPTSSPLPPPTPSAPVVVVRRDSVTHYGFALNFDAEEAMMTPASAGK